MNDNDPRKAMNFDEPQAGQVILTPPSGTKLADIPLVEVKLVETVDILPNVFAGILIPVDEKDRKGILHLSWRHGKINYTSKVFASICRGNERWAHVNAANFQVFNVVPNDGELVIRVLINSHEETPFRVHIMVANAP